MKKKEIRKCLEEIKKEMELNNLNFLQIRGGLQYIEKILERIECKKDSKAPSPPVTWGTANFDLGMPTMTKATPENFTLTGDSPCDLSNG